MTSESSLSSSSQDPNSPDARLGPLASLRRAKEDKVQSATTGKARKLSVLNTCTRIICSGLKFTGLYLPMARATARPQVRERTVAIPRLPEQLQGVRILHLSDLHLDSFPEFGERLAALVRPLEFELAIVTGDFRFTARGKMEPMLRSVAPLCKELRRAPLGSFAVLGNHDTLDMVPRLEAMGLRVLLNERIEREGYALAGVDDSYFFRTYDLGRALDGRPDDQFTILLSHTPDLVQRAAKMGVDLYLCGHTHGGQICLPGGFPLVVNTTAGRRYIGGAWKEGAMLGYTSKGVGFSNVPLRTNCPAEIVVHRLTRG